jgi:predicted  nucleic acid-binding Zn-ribbon protein
MILINDNWETIRDLDDISKIIRKYYNDELADELDNLIPEHTDEDYYDLESELMDKECEISALEDELAEKDDEISDLKDEIMELEDRIDELKFMR